MNDSELVAAGWWNAFITKSVRRPATVHLKIDFLGRAGRISELHWPQRFPILSGFTSAEVNRCWGVPESDVVFGPPPATARSAGRGIHPPGCSGKIEMLRRD